MSHGIDRLVDAAQRKAVAASQMADAQRRLEEAVVWAIEHDGRTVTHVAGVVGMSRQGIYDLLARRRSG